MTWHSAHDLTNTRSCAVQGCTGIAYKRDNDLCEWHDRNGTPDQYGTRKIKTVTLTQDKIDQLQQRLDDLDRQRAANHEEGRRLDAERRRVYRRLTRAQEEAA